MIKQKELDVGKSEKKASYLNGKTNDGQPKTKFGKWMVYKAIPQWENNVMALVYVGAAILVIVVGLRGLGPIVGRTFFGFMTDSTGSISTSIVISALLIEFLMICTLAFFMFFKPEDADQMQAAAREGQSLDILPHLEKVKDYIERYVDDNKGVLLHDEYKNFQVAVDKVEFFINTEMKRRSTNDEETD